MCVTGAAGQIAYSLLYSIANGDVFGPNQVGYLTFILSFIMMSFQPIELTLLDITPMMSSVHGVVMELQDCALTLLKGILFLQHASLIHSLSLSLFRCCSY